MGCQSGLILRDVRIVSGLWNLLAVLRNSCEMSHHTAFVGCPARQGVLFVECPPQFRARVMSDVFQKLFLLDVQSGLILRDVLIVSGLWNVLAVRRKFLGDVLTILRLWDVLLVSIYFLWNGPKVSRL